MGDIAQGSCWVKRSELSLICNEALEWGRDRSSSSGNEGETVICIESEFCDIAMRESASNQIECEYTRLHRYQSAHT